MRHEIPRERRDLTKVLVMLRREARPRLRRPARTRARLPALLAEAIIHTDDQQMPLRPGRGADRLDRCLDKARRFLSNSNHQNKIPSNGIYSSRAPRSNARHSASLSVVILW